MVADVLPLAVPMQSCSGALSGMNGSARLCVAGAVRATRVRMLGLPAPRPSSNAAEAAWGKLEPTRGSRTQVPLPAPAVPRPNVQRTKTV